MVTSTTARGTRLPPEEIGYLVAGPGRAAETALARLLDADLVRVSRDGLVSAVHQTELGASTAVETFILVNLRKAVRFDAVVRNAAKSAEMRALHQQLRARRLTRDPRPRLAAWWVFLAIGVVLTLLALLEPWTLFGAVMFLGAAYWTYGAKPLTRAGRAALKDVTASDRVLTVALEGFRGRIGNQSVGELFGLPQSVVKMLPRKKKRKAGNGGATGAAGCGSSSCGTSSSCSSGSGSSCSGGSSCGGGGGGGGD
ncbi:TIGR04222 domain-containing membrane protein [Lentzea sp. BCCO 10_0798]|uniref:TIGR04222 domain-containing membrane protein n=1 Tax=Lentzea kristufekii TaxID=3095430 RepID=A0ABU4U2R7_9PSEU|nr:TIGR04222 domain-containing membrane protein [Lentzea sp. BCCO 10_0798]MDX8054865.1 TIGR04222 domain-containing membrane protein [Lentzea sp. BCCO 10_0798]